MTPPAGAPGDGLGRVLRRCGREVLGLVRAEGGDLDDLVVEEDVREAKAPADDAAVAEELLDVVRPGRGPDVEVLGRALEEKVPDAATDDVGGVAEAAQSLDDLGRVRVDQVRRDRPVVNLRLFGTLFGSGERRLADLFGFPCAAEEFPDVLDDHLGRYILRTDATITKH